MIVKNYVINQRTVLLTGEYALEGRLCTRIVEGYRTFLVDKKSLEVLDATLKSVGFDLRGAREGAKYHLNGESMCPIIVNPIKGICMFPINSPYKYDCIWLNPKHIVKTESKGRKTIVYFSNGYYITIGLSQMVFNNKWNKADQLIRITTKNGNNPCTLHLELKKENEIIQEECGRYNFNMFIMKKEKEEQPNSQKKVLYYFLRTPNKKTGEDGEEMKERNR